MGDMQVNMAGIVYLARAVWQVLGKTVGVCVSVNIQPARITLDRHMHSCAFVDSATESRGLVFS